MFNLLTERAKKNAAQEYRFRLAIVICLFIAAEICFAALGGIFSFIALKNEDTDLAQEVAMLHHTDGHATSTALIATVTKLKARLALLGAPPPVPPSDALAAVLSLRPVGVSLISFILAPSTEGGWTVSMTGMAATRDVLAMFEHALTGDRRFAHAEVPIGSFAKDKSIQFTATAAYRGQP